MRTLVQGIRVKWCCSTYIIIRCRAWWAACMCLSPYYGNGDLIKHFENGLVKKFMEPTRIEPQAPAGDSHYQHKFSTLKVFVNDLSHLQLHSLYFCGTLCKQKCVVLLTIMWVVSFPLVPKTQVTHFC